MATIKNKFNTLIFPEEATEETRKFYSFFLRFIEKAYNNPLFQYHVLLCMTTGKTINETYNKAPIATTVSLEDLKLNLDLCRVYIQSFLQEIVELSGKSIEEVIAEIENKKE